MTIVELTESCQSVGELERRIATLSGEDPKGFSALVGNSVWGMARDIAMHCASFGPPEATGSWKVALMQILAFASHNGLDIDQAAAEYCQLAECEGPPGYIADALEVLRAIVEVIRDNLKTTTSPRVSESPTAEPDEEEPENAQADEPTERRWLLITAFLPGPYFDHEIKAIERDIRELHARMKLLPRGSHPIGGLSAERTTGKKAGVKVKFPEIVISGSPERFFWWPPTVREFSGFEGLQVETAERWSNDRVARAVCDPEGKRLFRYGQGDLNDPTNATQALFTVRSFVPGGGVPQDEQGHDILQLGCVTVDVILQLEEGKKRLDPPHFLVQQHRIVQVEEDLLALRPKTIWFEEFAKDKSTGRLGLPRMPHEMRIFRNAIAAALKKSRHPEDRETACYFAEKGKRRTR